MKAMIISVGATPEPVVASILDHKPKYVCFFASRQTIKFIARIIEMIEEKKHKMTGDKVICDDANSLPHCYEKALECTDKLIEQEIEPQNVVVDYTGGTKTMTAALTLATFGHGYNFSYVGGEKRTKDGVGVVITGSESVITGVSPWELVAVEEKRRKSLFISTSIAHAEQEARIKERNKVIADLSHHIKNLISTVIDPLENLKQETTVKKQVVKNALKGSNLIRETVNAMNLSFKGTIDDFYYDASHNTGRNRSDIQSIIIESLKHSIRHMFDGKYFERFNRKYFPTKAMHMEAKSEWEKISQSEELTPIFTFINRYFFRADICLGNAANFIMGNNKGSAIKLLILIQEIIFNAVKYAAFVSFEKRFLTIRFSDNENRISIRVENSFKSSVVTKTSGLGHIIINNFSNLLDTEPIVEKEDSKYSTEIVFTNFWKEEVR